MIVDWFELIIPKFSGYSIVQSLAHSLTRSLRFGTVRSVGSTVGYSPLIDVIDDVNIDRIDCCVVCPLLLQIPNSLSQHHQQLVDSLFYQYNIHPS